MEATIVLVLLLTLLVGGMLLALVMGYRDIEASRARDAAATGAAARPPAAVLVPSFFSRPEERQAARRALALEAALLARLEQHVRAEHATVAEFVHFPSVESLYRQSDSSLRVQ